jgi:hypothetical protein
MGDNKPIKLQYKVKIDFPWSMHEVGDIITVYESSKMAYVVQVPDEDDCGESDKFDLSDFPEVYELIGVAV